MANHDYQALRIAIDRGVAFVTIDNGRSTCSTRR